jgi:hypothetical protein
MTDISPKDDLPLHTIATVYNTLKEKESVAITVRKSRSADLCLDAEKRF